MATIDQLADTMRDCLEHKQRANGADFISIRDGSPSWIQDVCHAAHGDMFPDDNKYQFIADALDIIVETSDEDDVNQSLDSDVDVYTHDLLTWLSSSISRTSYVDEAVSENGWSDLNAALMQGQYAERREVYDAVYRALEDLASEAEEEEAEALA